MSVPLQTKWLWVRIPLLLLEEWCVESSNEIIKWMVASNTDLLSVTQSFSSPNRELHCVKSARIRSSSCPYFPAFRLNTERYCPNAGKYGQKKTPNTDTFPAVLWGSPFSQIYFCRCYFLKCTFCRRFLSNIRLPTFLVLFKRVNLWLAEWVNWREKSVVRLIKFSQFSKGFIASPKFSQSLCFLIRLNTTTQV